MNKSVEQMNKNKYIPKMEYEQHKCRKYNCDGCDYIFMMFNHPRNYKVFTDENIKINIIKDNAYVKWKNGSCDTLKNWLDAEDEFYRKQYDDFYYSVLSPLYDTHYLYYQNSDIKTDLD